MSIGSREEGPSSPPISGSAKVEREPLLFLCHRIPYPPDKGDKIRSYHLLRHLARDYDVYLATFVDDPRDWVHLPFLREFCAEVCAVSLAALPAKVWSTTGLLRGLPLSVPYYESRKLAAWVAEKQLELVFKRRIVFSSVMSQFLPATPPGARTIVDFVDVDSDKWRQYAQTKGGIVSWIFAREAKLLQRWEVALANQADVSLFVSSTEAAFFRSVSGLPDDRCSHYCNGVDASFFDPSLRLEKGQSPEHELTQPKDDALELVFTGAMDYWPNIDAVCWFAHDVLPLIRESYPNVSFTIVGGSPSHEVHALSEIPGVTVTGRVPDVRPYIARASAVVAPMRVARGVQNKVLEGMAMEKAVITTSIGLEGIQATHGVNVLVANSPSEIADVLLTCRDSKLQALGAEARNFVVERHSWSASLAPLAAIIEGEADD